MKCNIKPVNITEISSLEENLISALPKDLRMLPGKNIIETILGKSQKKKLENEVN